MIIAASGAVVAELKWWLSLEKIALRCSTRRRSVTSVAIASAAKWLPKAIGLQMTSTSMRLPSLRRCRQMWPWSAVFNATLLRRHILFRRPDVHDGHRQELLARIAVMLGSPPR